MNVSDYTAAGYRLSQLISQAEVTHAEKSVLAAYIIPMCGDVPTQAEIEAEPIRTALMVISYLYIQKHSAVATRAGAKTKMTPQSNTPTYEDVLVQNAPECYRALQALDVTKRPEKVCSDILGIFFRSTYFATR